MAVPNYLKKNMPPDVSNKWSEKFFLTNACSHRYQSRRAVVIAVQMMFDALENKELPYFKYRNDPKRFTQEMRKFWLNASEFAFNNEKKRGIGIGTNEKYPNTNKVDGVSKSIRGVWDIKQHNKPYQGRIRRAKKEQLNKENNETGTKG